MVSGSKIVSAVCFFSFLFSFTLRFWIAVRFETAALIDVVSFFWGTIGASTGTCIPETYIHNNAGMGGSLQ